MQSITSPLREHIDNIRNQIRHLDAKDNDIQSITLTMDDKTGLAIICIESAAKNALSGRMICELTDTLDKLAAWPLGKGVLIYGKNGFFCSGSDLTTVRQTANYEDGYKVAKVMQYNMAKLQSLPMVSLALIQGGALGGGSELCTATDLRIMTKSAKIGFVHMRVGVSPGWGGGTRLVQLVGHSRALEMISSARTVGAQEALQMGLCNYIIDDCEETEYDLIVAKAMNYLEKHTIGTPNTISAMKAMVNGARSYPFDQSLASEAQLFASTWGKPAHIQGVEANIKHR